MVSGEVMRSKYTLWLKRIRDTRVDEIDCSACLDRISAYVDLELSTGDAAQRMPEVRQHVDQCGVCFDEYQVLRDLARLEREGDTPSTDELIERLKKRSE